MVRWPAFRLCDAWYVIGADGARSVVRRSAGIERVGSRIRTN
ncbi:FAD-dependent monooxygenase [Pandoraea bronchicola]